MKPRDVVFALRTLRRSPGFTATAILTLALGIGASTAMFTVVDAVLLKALPYPDSGRIVAINTRWRDSDKVSPRTTGGDLMALREDAKSFEAFTYYHGGQFGVQVPGNAEFVGAYEVDAGFFRVFNVVPLAGRQMNIDDAGRSATVGLAFATRNFGSAEAALGKVLHIEGVPYQIVAVMPSWFSFPRKTEVWAAAPFIPFNQNHSGFNYYSVAKLRGGISAAMADANLDNIAVHLEAGFPRDNRQKTFVVSPLKKELAASVRPTLLILMGAVVLVLLTACANVASLMLARALSCSRELAVRAALGADRRRLLAPTLAESLVLGLAGALMGLTLARWGTQLMLAVSARFLPPTRLAAIHTDWRALAFAVLAATATSLIFGLAPAWQAARVNVQDALKPGGARGLLGGGAGGIRGALVMGQIALSLVLASGAGLLFRTFLALNAADVGYRTEGILVTYAHDPAKTTPELVHAGQFFDELFVRLRNLPGVISVAGAMGLPGGQYDSSGSFAIEGRQTFNDDLHKLPYAGYRLASPAYFQTMGIPLLRGRDFSNADVYDRPFVAIISQELARRNFPSEDPIGHRIMCGLDSLQWMTIVGVAGDVHQYSPASVPAPEIYMPLRQHPGPGNEIQIVTRTAGDPASFIATVQTAVHSMNPDVAMKSITMNDVVGDSVAAPRFRTVLAITFAGLALLLALSGMYALTSWLTTRRIPEFGLRAALGATPVGIISLVLGGALRLAIPGTVAGLMMSVAFSRVLSNMLFGVKATDASTYVEILFIVLPVIVLAAAVPALRAAQVDPMIALREE